jgi:quercetin dioxygenase-like cupin family protein
MKLASFVSSIALITSPLQAQERSDVAITQLLSATTTSSGQSIVMPRKDAQVVASIYEITPGATLPVQNHPFPRYAYVLSGTLLVNNLDTGQTNVYRPGNFILESVGQWQTDTNSGDEPLKLLVIDVVEQGQSNTVDLK